MASRAPRARADLQRCNRRRQPRRLLQPPRAPPPAPALKTASRESQRRPRPPPSREPPTCSTVPRRAGAHRQLRLPPPRRAAPLGLLGRRASATRAAAASCCSWPPAPLAGERRELAARPLEDTSAPAASSRHLAAQRVAVARRPSSDRAMKVVSPSIAKARRRRRGCRARRSHAARRCGITTPCIHLQTRRALRRATAGDTVGSGPEATASASTASFRRTSCARLGVPTSSPRIPATRPFEIRGPQAPTTCCRRAAVGRPPRRRHVGRRSRAGAAVGAVAGAQRHRRHARDPGVASTRARPLTSRFRVGAPLLVLQLLARNWSQQERDARGARAPPTAARARSFA